MAFSVLAALDAHVAALEVERQPDGTWHPSSISGCPRKAMYEFTGVPKSNPHDARASRVFRVGHILHEFVQEAISHSPDVVQVFSEVKLRWPEKRMSGACDGLVQYANGTWELLEFKTINSQAFRYGDLPKADHLKQASVYLAALRAVGGEALRDDAPPFVIPPLGDDLSRARFVYISKDDLRVEEFTMLWTEAKANWVEDRLALLEHYLRNETLPDRLPPMEKKGQLVRAYQCAYCPFKDTCWEDA